MTTGMEDPVTVAMIDGWIGDYYSRLVWKEFEEGGCILSPWVRDYIILVQKIKADRIIAHDVLGAEKGILTPGLNPQLLIDFMYKVSVGEKLFEDVEKSKYTLLEEAIEILDDMLTVDKLNRATVLHLKLLLRQHAVLVCCKKNEFDLAKEVFGREWRYYKNQKEMDFRGEILKVIEQRNSDQFYLDLMPYSTLIEGARAFLREIFSSLKTPFLVYAAENVYSKFTVLKRKNLSNDINQASHSNNGDTGTCRSKPTNDRKRNEMETIRNMETETGGSSRTAVRQEQIFDSSQVAVTAGTLKYGSLQMNSPETVARGSKDGGKSVRKYGSLQMNSPETVAEGSKDEETSVKKFKEECSSPSPMEPDENNAEQDPPNETSSRKKGPKDDNPVCLDWEAELNVAALPPHEPKYRRQYWTPEEEERIYLGAQKYGVGQWKQVASFLGSNRTNVDVKDKWRTMTKQGILKVYEKRFGPVK